MLIQHYSKNLDKFQYAENTFQTSNQRFLKYAYILLKARCNTLLFVNIRNSFCPICIVRRGLRLNVPLVKMSNSQRSCTLYIPECRLPLWCGLFAKADDAKRYRLHRRLQCCRVFRTNRSSGKLCRRLKLKYYLSLLHKTSFRLSFIKNSIVLRRSLAVCVLLT